MKKVLMKRVTVLLFTSLDSLEVAVCFLTSLLIICRMCLVISRYLIRTRKKNRYVSRPPAFFFISGTRNISYFSLHLSFHEKLGKFSFVNILVFFSLSNFLSVISFAK